jgi:hypothetical protein
MAQMPFYPPSLNGYVQFLLNQGFPQAALISQAPINLATGAGCFDTGPSTPLLAQMDVLLIAEIAPDCLPTDWVLWSYQNAINNVYSLIGALDPINYTLAVYNWGADWLLNWSPDQNGQNFFTNQRKVWNLLTPKTGLVESASDESTSSSYAVSDAMRNMTIGSLNQFNTPYGRAYLAIAQSMGTLWGLT